MSSRDQGASQDRVQSFLWGTTQQGDTFVPGAASEQSRSERVNSTIQTVDQQLPKPSVTQQKGHGPHARNAPHNGISADLNGVGQQFHGYTHHWKVVGVDCGVFGLEVSI